MTWDSKIQDQTYVLGQPKVLITIPTLIQTESCHFAVGYTLNNPPSYVSIEKNKIALFGSDLTKAGTFNAVLTATESKSGTKVDLQFQITALDCSPVGLSATPSTPKVTQLQAPQTIMLSQTQAPSQCGLYTNTISS